MRPCCYLIFLALACGTMTRAAPPATSAKPADWASFRGNPQLTGVASAPLSEKLIKLWKYDAGSAIDSTAAISGDRVYVGTDAGKLLAINLADGKLLWEFKAPDAISAAPCVAHGRVFVGDEIGNFYALDAATGKVQWRFKTGDKIASSAVAVGDLVLVGSYDHRLLCFQAATGALKWSFSADAQVHCSPCVAGDEAIIAGCDGKLRSINIQSGKDRLAVDINGPSAASPAFLAGCIYVGTLKGDCLAIALRDGAIAWKIIGDDPLHPIGQITASAAVTGDAVVFASQENQLFGVARGTGKPLWNFAAKSAFESSPVIAGGRIFVGCSDGNIYALDVAHGKMVWKFTAGGEIKASPAIAAGRLVIGNSDGSLFCFGSAPP